MCNFILNYYHAHIRINLTHLIQLCSFYVRESLRPGRHVTPINGDFVLLDDSAGPFSGKYWTTVREIFETLNIPGRKFEGLVQGTKVYGWQAHYMGANRRPSIRSNIVNVTCGGNKWLKVSDIVMYDIHYICMHDIHYICMHMHMFCSNTSLVVACQSLNIHDPAFDSSS